MPAGDYFGITQIQAANVECHAADNATTQCAILGLMPGTIAVYT